LSQHRVPHEGRVEVAALPGGLDVRRLQVEQLHVVDGEAGLVQGGDQVVVGGAGEGHRHRPALEVGDLVDPVDGDQRLVVADDVVDPGHLVVDVEGLGQAADDGGTAGQGDVELTGEEGG